MDLRKQFVRRLESLERREMFSVTGFETSSTTSCESNDATHTDNVADSAYIGWRTGANQSTHTRHQATSSVVDRSGGVAAVAADRVYADQATSFDVNSTVYQA